MTDASTLARINELRAVAIGWQAKAMRASEAGHHMDAQQHMRRSTECAYAANKLEQAMKEATE